MEIKRYGEGLNFCNALTAGGFVFVSGDASEAPVEGIEAKAKALFEQLDASLAECGSDKEHIVAATIYLTDVDRDFDGFNKAWQEWLGDGPKPSRSCVQVKLIDQSWLVEITLTAAVK